MNLREALQGQIRQHAELSVPACRGGEILSKLPDEDRLAIDEARKTGLAVETIAKVLSQQGHPIGATTLRRHFRGMCACQ